VLDIVTVLFIIATSFLPRSKAIESLDVVFGVLILADFSARLIISRQPLRDFTRLSTWSDIVAIISFLAPLAGEAGGFLRALRTLRLLRDYQMVARLRIDSSFFRRNEEVIFAVANLAVFIFVMTGIVYETQKSHNNHIVNYADALYFTVTAHDHDRFRRHHLARNGWSSDNGRYNDIRRDSFPESRQGVVGSGQGTILVPDLRSSAP
jgi:voltage-gated potassium channel